NSAHTMDLAENMAGYIQAYCDVLEQELKKAEKTASVTVSDKALEPKHFIVRSRGIIETDRGYPIIVQRNVGFSLLPGGGAEGDETPEECFIREVREETGLEVVPLDRFLILTENYEDTRIVSHFFTCKVIAEHEKKLTENEIIKGSVCEFVSLEEMEAVFSDYERYKDIFTDKYRTYLRESLGIREYKRLKGLGV
ncbi:MAG: NUDIX hydrolase, partial [Clostridia bacterium]|nr:NUDIX hydrolase [Clostridia bacterium]